MPNFRGLPRHLRPDLLPARCRGSDSASTKEAVSGVYIRYMLGASDRVGNRLSGLGRK